MKRTVALSLAAATFAAAAAYKVPEQSLNSLARAGANVAFTDTADAAYYNPANMAFLDESRQLELNFMAIHLSAIKSSATGHETDEEDFFLPQIHLVTQPFGNFRFGLSVTEPGGLAKRWGDQIPEGWRAKKFELRVIEIAPSMSWKISDTLAVGAGIRYIYTDGEIETAGIPAGVHPAYPGGIPSITMEGDDQNFGYNLAIAYRPLAELSLAATYRSKVDLEEEGNTKFGPNAFNIPAGYPFAASVKVPLPATLSLAAAYTFESAGTTVEVEYERVFWSDYESLDFNYKMPPIEKYFGRPIKKDWDDSNTFRISASYDFSDAVTLMVGYAYDETPVPEETLGYELPDSDANIFSAGIRYKVSDNLDAGVAFLYDKKDDRKVRNTVVGNTEFTDTSATLVSFGLGYRF